jgi:hypothetical protein
MMNLVNPLGNLIAGKLVVEQRPEPPQPRSGGRRETRQQIYSGKRVFTAPGRLDGKTAPIKRREPKRPVGMTAKDWKRARREAREQQQIRADAQ